MKVSALWPVLDAYSRAPFEYGKHDCCLFAARCLDAVCGGDYAARLSKCYRDKAGSRRFIAKHGGLAPAVSSFLGPLQSGLPSRGDVTLVDTEDGDGVGVCCGATIAVAADDGLEFYPLSAARGYWRV